MNASVEDIWNYLYSREIPVAVFLNKVDKENIDFKAVLKNLKERLSRQIVDIEVPDAAGSGFSCVVNLLQERIPEEDVSFRDLLVEDISSCDDVLTEEYLEGKQISLEGLKETLKKEIRERKAFPLLCGSATRNIGIIELADFIAEYLPSPSLPVDNAYFSALVYKTLSEPGMGHLNLIRVLSGGLSAGKDICNFTRQARERVGQMAFIQGKRKIDAHEASTGDRVALLKLKDPRTNDIIGAEKCMPPSLQIQFPPAVYHRTISVQSKSDDEKVGNAMAVATLENPVIRHFYNPETKEMMVSGLGSLQLEIMAQKIRSRYGINVELCAPKVPYKETVRGKAEVQGKYKRQSGGRGQYGDCWLRIEPLERGRGFEFADRIVGGAIPRNYIPAVEKGVREAMESGVIAGYPVVDIRVTLYDGSYHDVDSSDMAFKIAGAMALRKGIGEAMPVILEPIMEVDVIVPGEYTGAVIGDINLRHGRVIGMEKTGEKEMIRARIPMGQVFEYATDLRSLTKGSGKFSMKHSHYEEAARDIALPLIEFHRRARSAEGEKEKTA